MNVIPRYFCVLLCILINIYIVLFYICIFFTFAYIESWSSYSFATHLFHSTLFLRFLATCTGSSTDVEWDWQTMAQRAVCNTPLFTCCLWVCFRATVAELSCCDRAHKAYKPKIFTVWHFTKRWPACGVVFLCVSKEVCVSPVIQNQTGSAFSTVIHCQEHPHATSHTYVHVRDCLTGRCWEVWSLGCGD